MAPSPTIPTSFVPKQPVKSAARFTRSGGNTFLMFSLVMFGAAAMGAVGVFAYGEYLKTVEKSKAVTLSAAEESIGSTEVEDFVRSRDRFEAATGILDNHIQVSNFFDLLESITLVNVRYSNFTFGTLEDGTAEIQLSGEARSFNALAAQSAAFSSQKDIRRAIFSGIQVDDSGAVGFTIDAQVDAELLKYAVEGSAQVPSEIPQNVPSAPAPAPTPAVATSTPASPATPATPAAPSVPTTPPASSPSPAAPPTSGPVTPPQL